MDNDIKRMHGNPPLEENDQIFSSWGLEDRDLIETVFHQGSFCRYCAENGFIYADELQNFDFNSLIKIPGIGEKKAKEIKETYDNYKREDVLLGTHLCSGTEKDLCFFKDIHISNKKLDVSVLRHWTAGAKTAEILKCRGYHTLGDLAKVGEKTFKRLLGSGREQKIKLAATKFQKPINVLTEEVAGMDARSLEIYEYRTVGFTLSEIAEEYGLTRERVRQLCIKFESKVLPFSEGVASKLEKETGEKVVTEEDFLSEFENRTIGRIAFAVLSASDRYEYLDFAEIMVNREAYPPVEAKLCQLMDEVVGDGVDLAEDQENIERQIEELGFDFITIDHLRNLMLKNNCKFYGDYVIRNRKSYAVLCTKLVAEEFPNGIHVAEKDDIKRLRDLASARYKGLILPENDRTLMSRVSVHLILRGRGIYIAPRNIEKFSDALTEVKKFIDSSPREKIYFSEIFSQFEGFLSIMCGIDNEYYLHGVFTYLFPEEYEYSKDCLYKQEDHECEALIDQIEGIIVSHGSAVHKRDILKELPGVSESMLYTACAENLKVIQWGNGYFNVMNNIDMTEEEISDLKQILDALIEKYGGYCSAKLFFNEANVKMLNSLKHNNMQCSKNLFFTAASLFSDTYKFKWPHIFPSNRFDPENMKTIALDLMGNPDVLRSQDFFDLAGRLLWSPISSDCAFTEIEQEYVRISTDEYIIKRKFSLSDLDNKYIHDILEQECEKSGYLPLMKFNGSECELPCGLPVNGFLIESIIASSHDFGWHVVVPIVKDRRYEKGILVRNSIDIDTFDELVAYILAGDEITEIKRSQLLDYLRVHQLVRDSIPHEILASEYFEVSDDVFSIKLSTEMQNKKLPC